MNQNKKIIVVLGMHRSGTSAITRGLQVMGVSLGDNLMPQVDGVNEKGFWEDLDIHWFNHQLLDFVGSDWHQFSEIKFPPLDVLCKKDYFLYVVDMLNQKTQNVDVFSFKDPRLVKLMAFWKEVFHYGNFDVSYALMVRHPLSVVKSLEKRDKLDAQYCYCLWLDYVLHALLESAGSRRVLIDYDCLIESPEAELQHIAQFMGLPIDPVKLVDYKSNFLSKDLRHTTYVLDDLLMDDKCPVLVHEVYKVLCDVALRKITLDDVKLTEKLAGWIKEFQGLRDIISTTPVVEKLMAI